MAAFLDRLPEDILHKQITQNMQERKRHAHRVLQKRGDAVMKHLTGLVIYHKVWREGMIDDQDYIEEHGLDWKSFLFEAGWIDVYPSWLNLANKSCACDWCSLVV